jgi:hypothetical protein
MTRHTHFSIVGMVRYGAEREAEIQTLLASAPDEINWDEGDAGAVEALKTYFAAVQAGAEALTG